MSDAVVLRHGPLATYGRYDGAFFLELLHRLVHFLAVKPREFGNLTCVEGFASRL